MKWCTSCKQNKPDSAFGKHKGHPRGLASYCLPCARKASRESYHKHKDKRQARVRDLRLETLAAYGGRCECCGETRVPFLAIDHVGGGGRQHQREVGRGTQIYRWLKKQGYPQEGYRILCHNCNMASYWGTCPHKETDGKR